MERKKAVLALISAGICFTFPLKMFSSKTLAQSRSTGNIYGLAHIQEKGDTNFYEREWVGSKGEKRRLEGFELELDDIPGVKLVYMCHVEDSGDTDWYSEGQYCGTRGRGKRIEGFAIDLRGRNADDYNVKYQCHIQDLKDDQTQKNGEYCGTRGQSLRLEAMRVWIKRR